MRAVGETPITDSLAAANWMQQALAVSAAFVLDSDAPDKEKLGALLKIADRMAKLRDPDRLFNAERALRDQHQHEEEKRPGPQVTDAPQIDSTAGAVTARRGRPPRRALC